MVFPANLVSCQDKLAQPAPFPGQPGLLSQELSPAPWSPPQGRNNGEGRPLAGPRPGQSPLMIMGGERLLNTVGGTSSLLAQTLPFPPFGRGGSPEKGVVLD